MVQAPCEEGGMKQSGCLKKKWYNQCERCHRERSTWFERIQTDVLHLRDMDWNKFFLKHVSNRYVALFYLILKPYTSDNPPPSVSAPSSRLS